MKLKDVTLAVANVAELACDDEQAHSLEDDLHRQVLIAIAHGARNPRALAKEAIRTLEIDFSRWTG